MTKTKLLKKLNAKIDELIINGQTATEEFKRLCRLHKIIVYEK